MEELELAAWFGILDFYLTCRVAVIRSRPLPLPRLSLSDLKGRQSIRLTTQTNG